MTILDKIRQWHKDRKITINGNSNGQFLKLVEEVGELSSALAKNDKKEVIDAVGDIVVVLVALSELEGFSLEEAIEVAYNEIKDRKGVLLKNGVFVKE